MQVDTQFTKWRFFFASFYCFTIITFAITCILAARHIHLNSQQVEKLGIRTNSTIMKAYVTVWVIFAFLWLLLAIITIWFEKVVAKKGWNWHSAPDIDEDGFLKISIAGCVVMDILYVMTAALEVMILYAYYRLSKKLSVQFTKVVALSLQPD